MAHPNN